MKLLLRTSRDFSGSILRGGRLNFRNEYEHGGITRVIFTQTRRRGDRGERRPEPGSNSSQGYPVPWKYG